MYGFRGNVVPHDSCKAAYYEHVASTSTRHNLEQVKQLYASRKKQIDEQLARLKVERREELWRRRRASTKYEQEDFWESFSVERDPFEEFAKDMLSKVRCQEFIKTAKGAERCKSKLKLDVVHTIVAGENVGKQNLRIMCSSGHMERIVPIKLFGYGKPT